jgi:hypothetical protein
MSTRMLIMAFAPCSRVDASSIGLQLPDQVSRPATASGGSAVAGRLIGRWRSANGLAWRNLMCSQKGSAFSTTPRKPNPFD